MPHQIFVDAPTARLAAWEYAGADGPTIVMLHGLTDLAWSLHPIAAELAAAYRVVSLDLRGHGDSSHPGQYSVANFVSDLRVVLAELELERPILFGHSLGSIVSAYYAATWPDHPAALVMVEGLGPPPRVGAGSAESRLAVARGTIDSVTDDPTRPPMAGIDVARARLARAHPSLDDERIAELAGHGTLELDDGSVVWKFDPFCREWSATFTHEQQEERWSMIRCPTMIVTGLRAWEQWWKPAGEMRPGPGFDGPTSPAELDRRLATFADVEHHEVDAGHMVHFDAPDVVVELTSDFLDRRLA